MKYLCASCQKEFPAEKAIDGFSQGCKEGFLCPHCNSNLIDCRESWVVDFALFIIPLSIALAGLGVRGRFSSSSTHPIWELVFGGLIVVVVLLPVIFFRIIRRSKKMIKTKVISNL